MTWSRRDPDGRATWEWIVIDGNSAVRWRRVGTHEQDPLASLSGGSEFEPADIDETVYGR